MAAQRGTKTKKRTRRPRDTKVDARLVRAVGHPVRVNALVIFNKRIASPNEIAKELGENLSNVSYHVKVLRECKFVELVRTEQRRGAVEHFYRGTQRALLPDDLLSKLPPGPRTEIIGDALRETIEDATESLRDGTFTQRDDYHVSNTSLVLDERGWQGMTALLAETLERLFDLQAESSERLANGSESGVSATVSLLGFESLRGKQDKPAKTVS